MRPEEWLKRRQPLRLRRKPQLNSNRRAWKRALRRAKENNLHPESSSQRFSPAKRVKKVRKAKVMARVKVKKDRQLNKKRNSLKPLLR